MKRLYRTMALGLLGLVVGAWAAAGDGVTILILSDRGIDNSLTPNQVKQRNQMGERWEQDLVNVLTKRGNYTAKLIQTRDDFKAGPGVYLLATKIVRYNPGNVAARAIVGFGAGSASMDIHYELFGQAKEPLVSKDDGVGSSRDWRNVARKLNEDILKEISPLAK